MVEYGGKRWSGPTWYKSRDMGYGVEVTFYAWKYVTTYVVRRSRIRIRNIQTLSLLCWFIKESSFITNPIPHCRNRSQFWFSTKIVQLGGTQNGSSITHYTYPAPPLFEIFFAGKNDKNDGSSASHSLLKRECWSVSAKCEAEIICQVVIKLVQMSRRYGDRTDGRDWWWYFLLVLSL